jgi:hypothetical protein
MRDSKDSVKFMQVLDRAIFTKLKGMAKARGVTVQELIRVLVIPDWMRKSAEEISRVESSKRWRRARTRRRIQSPSIVKVRTPRRGF